MKKLILATAIAGLFLASCSNKATTTGSAADSTAIYLKKITQVAMTSDSAFGKKDAATAMKDYAANFVEYGSDGKAITNLDTLKKGAASFFDAFPDFSASKLHATSADSTVVIIGEWSGTFKKEYMKIKPTNKSFKVWDADIFTFNKAGKITTHKSVQSEATFFSQLDITMPKKK